MLYKHPLLALPWSVDPQAARRPEDFVELIENRHRRIEFNIMELARSIAKALLGDVSSGC